MHARGSRTASREALRNALSAVECVLMCAALVACGSSAPAPSGLTQGTTGSSGEPAPIVGATKSAGPITTPQLCQAAFPRDQLLSWASGTVAQFRSYQYGGPVATRPLMAAFSDLPGDTAGAWCGVRVSADTVRWWVVVEGEEPLKAIEITGPGESRQRGQVQGPPVVP